MKILDVQTMVSSYLAELKEAYESFPTSELAQLAGVLRALPENATLYVIGNGGSAATAAHMATDLGVGSLSRSNPVRCISLVENTGVLTATGNDMDFSSIFKQQLKLLGRRGDILICISASGNSTNLIDAVLEAKNLGIFTVAITGFDGGQLRNICDINLHTPTRIGSYGVVEDIHSTVSHVLTEVIRSL